MASRRHPPSVHTPLCHRRDMHQLRHGDGVTRVSPSRWSGAETLGQRLVHMCAQECSTRMAEMPGARGAIGHTVGASRCIGARQHAGAGRRAETDRPRTERFAVIRLAGNSLTTGAGYGSGKPNCSAVAASPAGPHRFATCSVVDRERSSPRSG